VKAAAIALSLAAVACSRADLDAITRGATDGGADTMPPITCPTVALQPGNTMKTIQVAGTARSYVLHVPAGYDGRKPVPLLLDFHGLATSGSYEQMASAYPPQTDPDGAVMAFPSGLNGPSGAGWDVGPCCVGNVDDVAFSRAVVADVSTTACIDPKLVYAAGFSMGGGMAYYLGCHAADVFAGVAASSFDLLAENVGDCLPPRPITVISFRGTGDNLVPYDGGPSSVVPGMPVTFLGAQGTFQKWAAIDQCSGSPSAADANGCSTYSSCGGGVEVVLCTDAGGQKQGNAAVAWPLLKRHPLP
jgi:polyhydroxybutyrate depolymerase